MPEDRAAVHSGASQQAGDIGSQISKMKGQGKAVFICARENLI